MSAESDQPVATGQTREQPATAELDTASATVVGTAFRIVLIVAILCSAFFIGGFLRFATAISQIAPPETVSADAIVVLTGGADRINGALDLLAKGNAKRLLISGVHPRTSRDALAKITASRDELFACCVDLDKKAEDTIGNAAQTSAWANEYSFKSLIVVTSAYHMPRSMAELRKVMPNVDLKPYPVVRQNLNLHEWYAHWGATRLLLHEYMKYVAARLRLSMNEDAIIPRRFVSCADCRPTARQGTL